MLSKQEVKKQCKEYKIEKIPPLKAIRYKCLDCCCNSRTEVDECPVHTCSLWPYREGISPFSERARNMTEEQRKAIGERFKKYHEEQNNKNKGEK